MSPLVGKQAHQSQTPDIPCAKVTHPHTVLQYLYRHFGFFTPSFHLFHILLSYINIPQTHPLSRLHFHHPHKFSGKPELETNLSKTVLTHH